jgi:hypothetical protein
MQTETVPSEILPVWNHWSADVVTRVHRFTRRWGPHLPRVRVLPGNPSLPLRVMLGGLSRRMNGGVNGAALGIDLSLRGNEVRKLFYAGGFTGVLLREGIDPDEFLQEVYKGILARNRGTCPWDVKKSSFGHYVHIIIRCVLSNYLRRERLRDSRETVTEDGEMPTLNEAHISGDGVELGDLLDGLYGTGDERDLVHRFLSALYAGRSRKDALAGVGMSESWGAQVLSEVRATLSEDT